MSKKYLYKSRIEKKISGVCGGLAVYLDTDPTVIRLAWIIFTVLTGIVPGIVAYIVAAMVMPVEPAHTHGGDHHESNHTEE